MKNHNMGQKTLHNHDNGPKNNKIDIKNNKMEPKTRTVLQLKMSAIKCKVISMCLLRGHLPASYLVTKRYLVIVIEQRQQVSKDTIN